MKIVPAAVFSIEIIDWARTLASAVADGWLVGAEGVSGRSMKDLEKLLLIILFTTKY